MTALEWLIGHDGHAGVLEMLNHCGEVLGEKRRMPMRGLLKRMNSRVLGIERLAETFSRAFRVEPTYTLQAFPHRGDAKGHKLIEIRSGNC